MVVSHDIFISVDMKTIGGVTSLSHVFSEEKDYQKYREKAPKLYMGNECGLGRRTGAK